MSEFVLNPSQQQLVVDKLLEAGDPLAAINEASHEILPGYDKTTYNAVDAVASGSGSCFAHAEVVANVAAAIPEVIPLIVLDWYPHNKFTHAECVIVLPDEEPYIIDSSVTKLVGNPFKKALELDSYAAKLVRITEDLGDLTVYGSKTYSDWILADADMPGRINTAVVEPGQHHHRLLMTKSVGLKCLTATVEMLRLSRYGSATDYNEHIEANRPYLPPFEIIVKSKS